MADYTELELKTFELSKGDSNSSLSVTSLALISDLPPFQHPPEELHQLILSKQLWLVSPGVCRIQISVCQDQVSAALGESGVGFLEHIADAICQSSLWPVLGLTIKQEDIQYQPLYDGAPNLYFIVEHPQKSSLLLSPSHSPTARFNGVECLFRYQSNYSEVASANSDQDDIRDTDMDGSFPETTLKLKGPSHTDTPHEDEMSFNCWDDLMVDAAMNQTQQRWDDAAYLAQMALHVTIGIKKRMRGLRLFQLDSRPSLLELAPAIWNARYLETVTSHVANFPIISNILATCSRGQSSSLRQKSARLFIDDARSKQPEDGKEPGECLNLYQRSVQRRLWGLLLTTIKPTTRQKNTNSGVNSWRTEFTDENFKFRSTETDVLDEFEIGPVNIFDGTGSNNTGLDKFPDGRLSHEFIRNQVVDACGESDVVTEYQQWWYRREDIHLGTTHAIEEALPEDPDYQSDLIHSDSFLSQPSSSSRELLDIPTMQQYSSNDFMGSIVNVDNPHPSSQLFDVETTYGTSNETSYKLESVPGDDNYYTIWPNEVIMGDNHCPGEDMDSQAPQMYEY